ncbi:MAG TPA: diacylglycerol kinase family protein [Candidatus Limnocylindrales bacterium]
MTHALVLGRKRKGRQIGEAVRETRQRLEAAGWDVDSEVVLRKKELRKHAGRAVKDQLDMVVAVGGDGAVWQVVNALAESEVVLGIIPKGTGNLLAGNLEIPKAIDKAVKVLLEGKPRTIDLGRVTLDGADKDFAVACGIGFDAVVMDATEADQKRRWGKLAYVASAVREGRRVQEVKYEITIDGKTLKTAAAQVFIANFGRVGSIVEPRRRVIADDGKFDVFVVKAGGPVEGLLAGWSALRQKQLGETSDRRVLRARATEVTVTSTPAQLVETDGSVIGKTPISARIRPAALRVMAPARR